MREKPMSLWSSVLMIFAMVVLSLGVAACNNRSEQDQQIEKVTISVKQTCEDNESVYGLIDGIGSYEKGSIVTLSVSNTVDGYYFAGWLDSNNNLEAVTTKKITLNENAEVVALFKKGQKKTINSHLVIVNNGTITNFNAKTYIITCDSSIDERAFSYWKKDNSNCSVDSSFTFTDESITDDCVFTPVCANSGVFVGAFYADVDTTSINVPFTDGVITYTQLLSKIENGNYGDYNRQYDSYSDRLRKETSFEYAIIKGRYGESTEENYKSNTLRTITGSSYNSIRELNILVELDRTCIFAYYEVVGKIFFDVDGIEKVSIKEKDVFDLYGFSTRQEPILPDVVDKTVMLSKNPQGVEPHSDIIKLRMFVTQG